MSKSTENGRPRNKLALSNDEMELIKNGITSRRTAVNKKSNNDSSDEMTSSSGSDSEGSSNEQSSSNNSSGSESGSSSSEMDTDSDTKPKNNIKKKPLPKKPVHKASITRQSTNNKQSKPTTTTTNATKGGTRGRKPIEISSSESESESDSESSDINLDSDTSSSSDGGNKSKSTKKVVSTRGRTITKKDNNPPPPPQPTLSRLKKQGAVKANNNNNNNNSKTTNTNNNNNNNNTNKRKIGALNNNKSKKVESESSEEELEEESSSSSNEKDKVDNSEESNNESEEEEEEEEEESDYDDSKSGKHQDLKRVDIAKRLKTEFSIEKILDIRYLDNPINKNNNPTTTTSTTNTEDKMEIDHNNTSQTVHYSYTIDEDEDIKDKIVECFVKWHGLAFIHCKWVDRKLVEQTKSGKLRVKKYLQRVDEGFDRDDNRIQYQEFMQCEKILDDREGKRNGKEYLVKWRGQSYAMSTWETKEDLGDDAAIKQYKRFNVMPPSSELTDKPRPPPTAFKTISQSPDYFKDGNQLRPYQLEGLNWLSFCWHERRNTILGDEMGLGKTVQSVSIIETLRKVHGIRGPFLVIAPLSTIPHWKREFENWTDQSILVYHDSGEARNTIRKYEMYYPSKDGKTKSKITKFNTLITTYETVVSDQTYLSRIHWKYIVVDEAHRLKNKACKLTTELRTFKFDHLTLLTGTPIQNNTMELWSLLNFLEPEVFGDMQSFLEQYGDLKESTQVDSLQKVLKPYILRRMKENVEKSIAPKEETIVEVELTTIQKKYYRAIYEKNFNFLRKGGKGGPSLLNIMMELRKCCNHPYLIKGAEQSETAECKDDRDLIFEKLIQSSGKLVLIDKLLPKLKAGGHKVLIFSQMVAVLDILDDYLTYRGYIHERIDGSIKGNERQNAIDRFSRKDSDGFVFLLCTRAGGIGINLTAADTVIIFDSDWNPQNDLQAQARCHRIGQQKMVKVYRLVTRGTYERIMFDRASKKLGLDKVVLNKMNNTVAKEVPDKETINSLLKFGVYAIKDDDNSSERFYEEDIDKILDRSSTVVKQEEFDPLQNSFSTASFCSSTAATNIDVNDPNFWEKFVPDLDKGDDLDMLLPRSRKMVSKFVGLNEEVDTDSDQSDYDPDEDDVGENANANTTQSNNDSWSISERNRFKANLFIFGSGRWDLIKACANLERFTVEQVRQYGEAFITKIFSYNPEKDDSTPPPSFTELSALVESIEPQIFEYYGKAAHIPSSFYNLEKQNLTDQITLAQNNNVKPVNPYVKEISSDKRFCEYLSRNFKKVHRILTTTAAVSQILSIGYDKIVDKIGNCPDFPEKWWGYQQDLDLLLGSYKHGVGEYEKFRNDKDLSYSKYQFSNLSEKGGEEDGEDDQQDDQDQENGKSKKQKEPKEKKSDEEKQVKSKDSKSTTTSGDDENSNTTTYIWPSHKIIAHRFKRILRSIELYQKKLEKLAKKESKKASKSKKSEKDAKDKSSTSTSTTSTTSTSTTTNTEPQPKEVKTRKVEQKAEWTKREKTDFYKYITIIGTFEDENGQYMWDTLRDKANLRKKSNEMLFKYYEELLLKCHEKVNNELNTKSSDIDLTSSINGTGKDEAEGDGSGELTITQCKRLVNRILFFKKLRKAIQQEKTKPVLAAISQPSHFPAWWIPGVHDMSLIEGVSKHGYTEYDNICCDRELPFYSIYKKIAREKNHPVSDDDSTSVISGRKNKEKVMEIMGFPNSKIVAKRVENIIDFIQNPKKQRSHVDLHSSSSSVNNNHDSTTTSTTSTTTSTTSTTSSSTKQDKPPKQKQSKSTSKSVKEKTTNVTTEVQNTNNQNSNQQNNGLNGNSNTDQNGAYTSNYFKMSNFKQNDQVEFLPYSSPTLTSIQSSAAANSSNSSSSSSSTKKQKSIVDYLVAPSTSSSSRDQPSSSNHHHHHHHHHHSGNHSGSASASSSLSTSPKDSNNKKKDGETSTSRSYQDKDVIEFDSEDDELLLQRAKKKTKKHHDIVNVDEENNNNNQNHNNNDNNNNNQTYENMNNPQKSQFKSLFRPDEMDQIPDWVDKSKEMKDCDEELTTTNTDNINNNNNNILPPSKQNNIVNILNNDNGNEENGQVDSFYVKIIN